MEMHLSNEINEDEKDKITVLGNLIKYEHFQFHRFVRKPNPFDHSIKY